MFSAPHRRREAAALRLAPPLARRSDELVTLPALGYVLLAREIAGLIASPAPDASVDAMRRMRMAQQRTGEKATREAVDYDKPHHAALPDASASRF